MNSGQANTALNPQYDEDYEQMRCDVYNQQIGTLNEFDCPICRNKGTIFYLRDGCITSKDCECATKRKSIQRIRRSGLENMLSENTFDTWETLNEWQNTAKAVALKYVNDAETEWFLAAGKSGSGKTHLCTAICGALIEKGEDTKYMMWKSESTRIKAFANDAEEYEHLIKPLKEIRVLYIDDLFKVGANATPTTADLNLAFEIINHRYMAKLKTIISTERSLDDLLDLDMAIGGRIYERCKGYYLDFSNKPNWRLRDEQAKG